MPIIGLTGGFCTGKTTVARMFASLGARIIDADQIAHRIIKPQSEAYRRIVSYFGKTVLNKNGKIDRAKLAGIVFENKAQLRRLSRIVHPIIIAEIKKRLFSLKKENPRSVIVIDAPLLMETGLNRIVDKLVVVEASPVNQIKRSVKRASLSRIEAIKRINSQLPLSKKVKIADYLIDNDSTIYRTKRQVQRIWEEIRR